MTDRIEAYYDQSPQTEWERLERHRTEFALTLRALRRHLSAGARILDVGGGPGRYAIALTELGHRVTLLDLSQANLEVARAKAGEHGVTLADIVHGNALDLSRFADGTYDAVLLMGPLYHLLEESERVQAVREALRVLRPGGLLFASVITRYAMVRDIASGEPEILIQFLPMVRQVLETGQFRARSASVFTDFYAFRPFDLGPWMESLGLTTVEQLGQEGLVSEIETRVNGLTGEAWEAWVEINELGGHDPSLWGQCQHLLYVGTR